MDLRPLYCILGMPAHGATVALILLIFIKLTQSPTMDPIYGWLVEHQVAWELEIH